ncbi:MAG TPA: gamma-glutamyltransferase [Phycisphaerae bacterium]|nr:gamma-glutamyltransferase [Phycisphaerae bacterium]
MSHTLIAITLIAATLALFALPPSARGGDRITGEIHATRSEVIARHAMAATSQPLATQAALDVLRRGGNAVDAAIAANACLALMEPVSCGLGGDLFAIVWDAKTQKLYGLNASGRAPAGLTLDELRSQCGPTIPMYGPLPVTTPGCVDGWFQLHDRFGRLPMADVLAPAIAYAREGFPVSELIAHYWALGGEARRDQPGFAATYLPDGHAPAKGEIFRNAALADTLAAIAAGGRDAFYRGALADRIDAFCRANGCYLRKTDLENHHSAWVEPLSTNYRGYDVWELPPNTQGVAVLEMLNILEGYDLRAMGHNSTDYLHTLVEAKKLAYADRARYYADPDFAKAPLDALISKAYAAKRRGLIDPHHAARAFPPGDFSSAAGDAALRSGDTIYLTTADADHNMVSLIQSNYGGFGCGLCPTGLGFGLQNRGALFNLDPDHPNAYAPGKRPFHTIIPAFVTRDGKPYMSFGVMGGDMQPQGHVQVLCNLIDFGMNLQEAGDAARFHHTGDQEPNGENTPTADEPATGGTIALESAITPQTRRDLIARGHRVVDRTGPFGGYQAIRYDAVNSVYYGASESRKDGQAAGY